MGDRYESRIDRQIREAQERGEFDNLPGAGKPLPGRGSAYDEDWWIKDWVRRENLTGLAPTSLQIRKEAEDLAQTLAGKSSDQGVRQATVGAAQLPLAITVKPKLVLPPPADSRRRWV